MNINERPISHHPLESGVRSYSRLFPVRFRTANGPYLFDSDGGRYIDFFCCAGSLNYGHNPPELGTPFSAIGDSYGLLVSDYDIISPALSKRSMIYSADRGNLQIGIFGLEDMLIEHQDGVAKVDGDIVKGFVRTPTSNTHTDKCEHALDVAVIGKHVVASKLGGGLTIPPTGCVLRFREDEAESRELFSKLIHEGQVKWQMSSQVPIRNALQTGPQIVSNGVEFTNNEELDTYSIPGQNPVVPSRAKDAWWNVKTRPRSGIGLNDDGKILFCIEDACDVSHISNRLIEMGAKEAVMLDAGGSACAFLGAGAVFANKDFRNHHQVFWDRPFPVALRLDQ